MKQITQSSTIYIKNMVCPRCIKVVKDEFYKLGIDVRSVELGEVVVGGTLQKKQTIQIRQMLEQHGFELIEDQKVKLIERIKLAVLKLVRHDEEQSPLQQKHSVFIAQEVGKDYHTLSSLFSSVENITLEQYIILQKIERVKELLKYGEQTLSEIAYRMEYSSVQHLSAQFKSVTGMTPSQFKKINIPLRKPLDNLR